MRRRGRRTAPTNLGLPRRRSLGGAAVSLASLGICAASLWVGPVAVAVDDQEPRTVFRFDDEVTESSGLVDLGSRVLTVNDSGDDAVVYVVDPATGRTVGRTTFADEATDVEALAVGPDGDVWVGDIGDNGGSRAGVRVHRIPPPRDGDRRVQATTYDLVYRGGARDAETLLVSPEGRLHVVSKGLFRGQVWQAPRTLREDRPNALEPVGDTGGLTTDGAWFPGGRHVVLRDYRDAFVYDVTALPWQFLGRVRLPSQQQGEGVAVRDDGSLLVSSEGTRTPVIEVPLPGRLAQVVAPGPGERDAPTEPVGDDAYSDRPPGTGLRSLVEDGADLRLTVAVGLVLLVIVVSVHRWLRIGPRR